MSAKRKFKPAHPLLGKEAWVVRRGLLYHGEVCHVEEGEDSYTLCCDDKEMLFVGLSALIFKRGDLLNAIERELLYWQARLAEAEAEEPK